MAFVIDCSTTMPWILKNDPTGYADQILSSFKESQAVVPELWFLEVSNVLLVCERRGRLDAEESIRFTSLLQELPISIDEGTSYRVFSKIINVARDYELNLYDATYLELAMREALPLATLDVALRTAAQEAGVEVVGI
ncbi:MAG: type II toxin-antitoxin system VapC family toxin [Gammaproteobacteria bacterium]|nr:type II toxin-antitoxin system VapC family toxin [Gammaproteobacteria bacterium]